MKYEIRLTKRAKKRLDKLGKDTKDRISQAFKNLVAVEIISEQPHSRGKIYVLGISGRTARVLFTSHAIERTKRWEITEEMVAETQLLPEEVLIGHRHRYIAHKRHDNHLVRAVYEYDGLLPVLLTVYFPHKDCYFKGDGIYEDKILK